MNSTRRPLGYTMSAAGLVRCAALLALLGMAGCAQVNDLKHKVNDELNGSPKVSVTPASKAAAAHEANGHSPSLGTIVNNELQHGHYSEGEQALQQYLQEHPDDRSAKALLQQLTVDPQQALGARSRNYVVKPGDSYSTLAARYLGDSQRFLILARYNGSTNPSVLHVGQTLRLPLSAPAAASVAEATPAVASSTPARSPVSDTATSTHEEASLPGESSPAKARRLQRESVASLEQGHKDQALVQLDEALSLDPHLKPSGSQAAALRQQLLAAYHQRAIVLYRDQKLDPAIALWDHLLAIDPSYEPAVIYRARAIELKQRLKQY